MYADCVGGERGPILRKQRRLFTQKAKKKVCFPYLHFCTHAWENRGFFLQCCVYTTCRSNTWLHYRAYTLYPWHACLVCLYKALSVHPVSPLGHLLALEVWKTARSLGLSYQRENKLWRRDQGLFFRLKNRKEKRENNFRGGRIKRANFALKTVLSKVRIGGYVFGTKYVDLLLFLYYY